MSSFVWRGGNGSFGAAANWTTGGGPAKRLPYTADSVAVTGPDDGVILATGPLNVASLLFGGGVAFTGNVGAGTLTIAGTLVLAAGARLEAVNATLASGALSDSGAGAGVLVTGTLALAGDATVLGGARLAAASVTLDGGTLEQDALSGIVVGSGPASAGTLAVLAGAALSGTGRISADAGAVIADNGTIAAVGGVLSLFGSVAGTGELAFGAGATLFAAGAVGAGITADFAGAAGTLELFTEAAAFAAAITGFAVGDAIDIASASITGAAWSAGVLTLTASDGGTLALALPDGGADSYDNDVFVPMPDGFGGTRVLLAGAEVAPPTSGAENYDPLPGTIDLFGGSQGHTSFLTIEGMVAIASLFSTSWLQLFGTLVAPTGSYFLATDANVVTGLLLDEGTRSGLVIRQTITLGATLTLLGGAAGTIGDLLLRDGSITLDALSSLAVGGAAHEAGTLSIAAGNTLAGNGRIAAPLDVAGEVLAQGGALTLSGAAGGTGTLAIGAGATLDAFGPEAANVVFAAGSTLALLGIAAGFGGTLTGFAVGDALDVGSTTLDGVAWTAGTLALLSGGTTVESLAIAGAYGGQSWQVAPDGTGGALVTVAAQDAAGPLMVTGTLAVPGTTAAATATAEAGALVAMAGGTLAVGALALDAGATLDGFGTVLGAVADAGTLSAEGGVLGVSGQVFGAGTVLIGAGATLYTPQGIDAATLVAFAGAGGTLELFQSAADMAATLTGFALGDAIDLAAAAVLAADWTAGAAGPGSLVLAGEAGELGTITLTGDFANAAFLTHPDGQGGTLVSLVPCFAAGTRIATPAGEIPVEWLRVGDPVLTPAGARPLCWVARRRCNTAAAPELRAVRIAAGALGAGRPRRDLRLSPQHALLVGTVLVPAVALVNGATIGREPGEVMTYHHIGLATHTTVLAEGAAVETFLPLVDAPLFDREHGARPAVAAPCAPRVEGGAALEALRLRFGEPPPAGPPGRMRGHLEHLAATGGATRIAGWALDRTQPGRPVTLTVLRDGSACGLAIANIWRPDLDRAGLAGGRCGFLLDVAGPPAGLAVVRACNGDKLPLLAAVPARSK